MALADYDAVWALWRETLPESLNDRDDSLEGISRYLARNPDTCFVAEEGVAVIGAVLAGHDGRRGYIYHMAVARGRRREGVASALVGAVETALRSCGIRKAALLAFGANEAANGFWETRGFDLRTDVGYRNKVLE